MRETGAKVDNRKLRNRYFLFIGSIVFTIVISQFIIQYDLDQQSEDARLINVAARQRMLSQRISKLVLFINYETNERDLPEYYNLDSLRIMVKRWQDANQYLIAQNENTRKSEEIRVLLNENLPRLKQIADAAEKFLV